MDDHARSKLKELTLQLAQINEEAQSFYLHKARGEGYEADFYKDVKPFADHVKKIKDEWFPLAYIFVQEERPLYLHPQQIQQLDDHLEVVAIKSFYKQSSLKIQMETYKSVHYTLDLFLRAFER